MTPIKATAEVTASNLWMQEDIPFRDIKIAIQEILACVVGVGDGVSDNPDDVDRGKVFPVTFSKVNHQESDRVLRVVIYPKEDYPDERRMKELLEERLAKLDVPLQIKVM